MKFDNEYLNETEARVFLKNETNQDYVFAQGALRKWGETNEIIQASGKDGFFQIMPDKFDDGFFEWYVRERRNRQFFELRETSIIHFLHFRKIWLELR